MSERFFPAVFVFLWASAFVAAKLGLTDSSPFSFLLTRFIIVALLFGGIVMLLKRAWIAQSELLPIATIGVLMHGVYLGGVFYAISKGTPAGIASLIVSVQPILTCFIALGFLNERIRSSQWLGIFLGFLGVLMVVSPRLGGEVPLVGLISCSVAVLSISVGTIMQKRFTANVDLITSNFIQALAAAGFYFLLVLSVEPYDFTWTPTVALAMLWIVVAVSLGAVSILMLLIRQGQMAAVSSLFFMVPPVSAVMGYVVFGEMLGLVAIIGFVMASIGVWLVNRPEKPSERKKSSEKLSQSSPLP